MMELIKRVYLNYKLPSYLHGNPWLEILSNLGKEEKSKSENKNQTN